MRTPITFMLVIGASGTLLAGPSQVALDSMEIKLPAKSEEVVKPPSAQPIPAARELADPEPFSPLQMPRHLEPRSVEFAFSVVPEVAGDSTVVPLASTLWPAAATFGGLAAATVLRQHRRR